MFINDIQFEGNKYTVQIIICCSNPAFILGTESSNLCMGKMCDHSIFGTPN